MSAFFNLPKWTSIGFLCGLLISTSPELGSDVLPLLGLIAATHIVLMLIELSRSGPMPETANVGSLN